MFEIEIRDSQKSHVLSLICIKTDNHSAKMIVEMNSSEKLGVWYRKKLNLNYSDIFYKSLFFDQFEQK